MKNNNHARIYNSNRVQELTIATGCNNHARINNNNPNEEKEREIWGKGREIYDSKGNNHGRVILGHIISIKILSVVISP